MSDPAGFDFSLVEEPLFQFMVVADSHDRLVGAVDPEFPSRARQHDRVMALLELLKKMPAEFLMHMGDLVQDYPETDAFQESISTAVKAFHQLPMPVNETLETIAFMEAASQSAAQSGIPVKTILKTS